LEKELKDLIIRMEKIIECIKDKDALDAFKLIINRLEKVVYKKSLTNCQCDNVLFCGIKNGEFIDCPFCGSSYIEE
jgi:hypothetical protein